MRTLTESAPAPVMSEQAPAQEALLGRLSPAVWRLQTAGLLAMTTTTFVPSLSHLQEYVFFALLALAAVTLYAEGRPLLFSSPLHRPIALLLGWILLSVPFAIDPSYSFSEWRKLLAKILLFYWAVTVWRVAGQEERPSMNHRLLGAVALGSLALSLYALPDFVQRGGTWTDRLVRAQAPGSDYNWLSTYMVMALPLLIAGAVMARPRWTQYAYTVAAVLAFTAQALSYTRAGWLGLLAQGYATGLLSKRARLFLAVLIGSVVLVALLSALGSLGYHKDTLDPWTLAARVAVWMLMLDEIAEHPLVGVGYGTDTFMVRLGEHPETAKAGGSHNFFLMVAMGSGIPALAFLVWILVAGLVECVRLARLYHTTHREPFTAAMLYAIALMIVGFAVRNGFDAMFAGSLACLFWLLLAAGIAQDPQLALARKGIPQ